jgi:hypothetical protein
VPGLLRARGALGVRVLDRSRDGLRDFAVLGVMGSASFEEELQAMCPARRSREISERNL